ELANVAEHYLHLPAPRLDELLGKGRNKLSYNQLDLETASQYAGRRPDLVLRLHDFFMTELNRTGELAGLYKHFEFPLTAVLQRMGRNGIRVEAEALGRQSQAIGVRLQEVEREAFRLAGEEFNLGSPKQLQTIFCEKLQLRVLKKPPTGQPSTAEPVLQELALDFELPRLIMDHRALSKLKS